MFLMKELHSIWTALHEQNVSEQKLLQYYIKFDSLKMTITGVLQKYAWGFIW